MKCRTEQKEQDTKTTTIKNEGQLDQVNETELKESYSFRVEVRSEINSLRLVTAALKKSREVARKAESIRIH
jgi:hypothetical protein